MKETVWERGYEGEQGGGSGVGRAKEVRAERVNRNR